MLRSVPSRRLLASLASRHRFCTSASSASSPQFSPSSDPPLPTSSPSSRSPEDPNFPQPSTGPQGAGAQARSSRPQRERKAADYEEEQARVLRAALSHVPRLGWSESAMITGARDVGVSPSIVGSFPRKEAALVEFFMDDCLHRLIDRIDSGEELESKILSERLAKLVRIRLEMQVPYVSKWAQALSIQAQPLNLPTSFRQRAELVDEIWHAAGDRGSDIDWYMKRTVLGGIYSTSEVYMLTDHSPEFRDTWTFLERRIKDAFDLRKSFQEAAYLAEAVGAGMGSSMQGFMKKVFQS